MSTTIFHPSERYLGARIDGGWTLQRLLGAGRFAWVYEATGAVGGKVAVKVLHRQDEQATRRFKREIKVLRELPPHPNCVGYRGHGVLGDGAPWCALELVDGFTLQSVLRAGRRLPERAVCALMAQVCDGFRELHRLGLAHRDITPDNIMITHGARQVKIMDFGLVLDSQGLLRLFEDRDILEGHDFADDLDAGLIAGTPEYMAPEQITDPHKPDSQRHATDTTADVFALGTILYQLLTGRQLFPFAAGSGGATGKEGLVRYLRWRQAWRAEDLPCPPEIGDELWTIVRKTLRPDPGGRQRSAAELGDDLRFYAQTGQGVLDDDLSATVSHPLDPTKLVDLQLSVGDFQSLRAIAETPPPIPRDGQTPPPLPGIPASSAPRPTSAPRSAQEPAPPTPARPRAPEPQPARLPPPELGAAEAPVDAPLRRPAPRPPPERAAATPHPTSGPRDHRLMTTTLLLSLGAIATLLLLYLVER